MAMKGLDELRGAMARYLLDHEVDAVTAWEPGMRTRRDGPAAVVSLRGCESGPAGLRDYLGERFDEKSGRWVELYGKRAEVTLGLDLYAPKALGEQGCAALFTKVAEVLAGGGPAGLTVMRLVCGEAVYDGQEGLFRCPVQAVCGVYLYASAEEDGTFSDFVVRGTKL